MSQKKNCAKKSVKTYVQDSYERVRDALSSSASDPHKVVLQQRLRSQTGKAHMHCKPEELANASTQGLVKQPVRVA